jgi:hypothetical protein
MVDLEIHSKFERWEEEVPNVSSNFENGLPYMTSSRILNKFIKVSQRRVKPMGLSLFE